MFHSVSLLSQAPLARGSCALPSVLLNIGPISIRYSKRGRYPLVSVNRVHFCGEQLFFPPFFFPFPLTFFKSCHRFSPWKSPHFTYHSLFFFPSFPPLLHFFFPLFLSYSNFFLPLFPCLPSLFLFFSHSFSSVNLSPVNQSTFITIPQSQINFIN